MAPSGKVRNKSQKNSSAKNNNNNNGPTMPNQTIESMTRPEVIFLNKYKLSFFSSLALSLFLLSFLKLENYARKLAEMIELEKREKNVINLEKNIMAQFFDNCQEKLNDSENELIKMESKIEQNNQIHSKELIVNFHPFFLENDF